MPRSLFAKRGVLQYYSKDPSEKNCFRCCLACKQPFESAKESFEHFHANMSFRINAEFANAAHEETDSKIVYAFGLRREKAHVVQNAMQNEALQEFYNFMLDNGYVNTSGRELFLLNLNADIQCNFKTYDLTIKQYNDPKYIIMHPELFSFFRRISSISKEMIIVPYTLPCCNHCNDVMDIRAKMRKILFGRGITDKKEQWASTGMVYLDMMIFKKSSKSFQVDTNSEAQKCLAAFYFHYLRNSLQGMQELQKQQKRPETDFREIFKTQKSHFIFLVWFVLVIYAHWLDMKKPEMNSVKAPYVYQGLLEMYISLFVYYCLLAEHPDYVLTFPQFHNYYFCELPSYAHSDENFWKPVPFVYDYVFKDFPLNIGHAESVTKLSDSLVRFYSTKIKIIMKSVMSPMPPEDLNDHTKYFCTLAEMFYVQNKIPSDATFDEIIDAVGILAVLWPFYRYVEKLSKPQLTTGMHAWIERITRRESRNIRQHRQLSNTQEALVVYKMQYLYGLENMMEKCDNNLQACMQSDEIINQMNDFEKARKCALLKTVARLMGHGAFDNSWRTKKLQRD